MDDLARRERLERLFRAHARVVSVYALRRVGPSAADDVVSEVFAIAWRRLDEIPEPAVGWLLACTRNVLAHQHRRATRDRALADRLYAHAPAIASNDGALADALSQLNERDREVLLLIAWEGLDRATAAQVLGCSRNTLAARLYRARKRLAVLLGRAERQRRATRSILPEEPTA